MTIDIAEARLCVQASADAYTSTPDIQSLMAHVRILTDSTGKMIIAFRGTDQPLDVLTDARIWRSRADGYEVHSGFLYGWRSVSEYVLNASKSSGRVVVTGHSLGGALAKLCALAIEKVTPGRVAAVHTFGQPRVGNRAFAYTYNAALRDRTFRWINQEDIVPRLPGVLTGYVHCGHEMFMPSIGPWRMPSPLWFKLLSDVVGAWREWKKGRVALLADHHIAGYQAQLLKPR